MPGSAMLRRSGPAIGAGLLVFVAAITVGGGDERSASPTVSETPLARISTRLDAPVTPLSPGDLGADTLAPAYHRFRARCAGCHVAPSPKALPPEGWPRVLERMSGHIEDAGLLPLDTDDRRSILDLLERHAPTAGP